VIGGRVIDASALVAFARGTSIDCRGRGLDRGCSIVLIMPSTAVAAAWAELAEEHHPVLEVLLQLPVTIVDNLDESRARAVGQLGGHQADAHAMVCAQERGWSLLTADSGRYARYGQTGVELEPVI
jgi:predicted nucleic acid-binding protein